jgi:glycosyltransferase involved in cell wall biosynthesis
MDDPGEFRPSALHRAWRMVPVHYRHLLLRKASAALAPRKSTSPPATTLGIAVVGELSRASGLGEGARLMLRALRELGIPSHPMDIGPLLPGHRPVLPSPGCSAPPPGYALVFHINPELLPLILLRLPRSLTRGRRVIGYWAWELPVAPAHWRSGARFVHEAWAGSRFTAAALEPILPGRVRVVPYPVALGFAPAESDRAGFELPAEAVVVLVSVNLASSFERKNPFGAVRAFQTAFGDRPDRILVLKTGNPDHFPAESARLFSAIKDAPNVRLITDPLSATDSLALIASADIVLSLHRSEGYGLVIAEAMLHAKPVIATGWSGNMDFMDETNSIPIPYHLVPVSDRRGVYNVPGAVWAEPDVTFAARQLSRRADDAVARQALGVRARAAASRLDATAALAAAVRNSPLPFAEEVGARRAPGEG